MRALDTIRYTPTCVGTTSQGTPMRAAIAVHPHVRGDNDNAHFSSDLVRRYTPTCVGTTSG